MPAFLVNFPPDFHQISTSFHPCRHFKHHNIHPRRVCFYIHYAFPPGGDTIKAARILVIEKDEALAAKATAALEEAGYKVAVAADALSGLKKLYEAYPDLIIVARELPAVNGEDPYLRIRQASYLPIIVLGRQEDAVETLECGADAYMTRPPSLNELVARVHVLLRRKPKFEPPEDKPRLEIKDYPSKKPKGNGNGENGENCSALTPTEFRLATCLVINRGQLLDYPRLISEVWGGKEVSRDTLHFYMRRLRQKLQDYIPGNIVNLQGVGYRLEGKPVTQWD